MFTGNTETNIAATYQDSDGTIDLVSTDTNTQLAFANDANNRVVTGDGSGGLNGEANLTFDGSTLKVNSTSVGIVDVYRSDGGNADEARISIGAYSSNPPSQRGVQVVAYNNNAGHDMHFRTSSSHSAGPTTKAEIGSNGNLKISDGDLVIGTSGHGISFAATGDGPSMGSELLDDYEEGTWEITDSSGNTVNTGNDVCRYTKIGNVVHVNGSIGYSAVSGTATVEFSLPFAAIANPSGGGANWGAGGVFPNNVNLSDGYAQIHGHLWGGSSVWRIYQSGDNTSWAYLHAGHFGTNSNMNFDFTYQTSA